MKKTLGDAQRTGAKILLPVPQEETAESSREDSLTAIKWATIVIAAILAGMVMLAAKTLLVPVVAALVAGSLIGPALDKAREHGVPPLLSALALVSILAVVGYFLVVLLAGPVASWITRAPEILQLVQSKFGWLERLLGAWREIEQSIRNLGGAPGPEVKVSTPIESIAATVLAMVTPAVGQLLIFGGALLFFLTGRKGLKQRFTLSFGDREHRLAVLRVISEIENSLATYLATATAINAGMGVAAASITAAFGIANPVMWGLAAFALNYIPYVGATIMTVMLFFVGLITFPGFFQAVLLPLCYVAVATVESHFVTPSVMGQRLHLNAFLVFLSLAFWTWMWGLAGAFLSVPILIAGLALFRHVLSEDEPNAALPD